MASFIGPVVLPGTELLWTKIGIARPLAVGLILCGPAYYLRPFDSKAEATPLQFLLFVAMTLAGAAFCFWISFVEHLNRAELGLLLSFMIGLPGTVLTWRTR